MAFGKKKNAKGQKNEKETKKEEKAKGEKKDGKKLGKKQIILIAIVLLIIVVAVVGAFAMRKLKGNKKNGKEATTEVTTEANPEGTTALAEDKTEAEPSGATVDETAFSDYGEPYFQRFAASSELRSSGYDYSPYCLGDLDPTTAWAEGIDNTGVGEWVDLSAREKQYVKGIRILNGYCKSADLYMKNGRVRTISIYSDEGLVKTVDLEDSYNTYQDIVFDQPILTNYLRFSIEDVYDGTKYDDTCISEIEVY